MRRRRADLDLTQELLAEQVGCAAETIRALENGRRRASREMADRLVMTLGIPPAERDAFVTLARAPVHGRGAPAPAGGRQAEDGALPPAVGQRPPLLATKLYRPRPSHDVVVRPRLVERLDQGLTRPLTLISAPAGFGKTTLLASWLNHLPLPSAWLTLDVHDDAPGPFLRYFVAALQRIDGAVDTQLASLVDVSDALPPQTVVAALLNDLAMVARDAVLVLDDLHAITNPAIYDLLAYLLDHLPPRLHLVILTREDPPLPLARLRARRQLVELRAADLRFTVAEAEAFLGEAMDLTLGADNIAALVGRTEGWIVGLQLAALSLRDLPPEEMVAAVDAFTGNNRFVVDYLVDEVTAGQPPYLQQFLLETSILQRLCGPLCDALLLPSDGRAEPNFWPANSGAAFSQRLLEELERANLFLIPLDGERRWYRYHQLFAEVMQARLLGGAAPEHVARLHRRASAWCEGQNLLAEAVQYALQARDWERVARLIEQRGSAYALHGQIETVRGWLDALPEATVRARPTLCVLHAGLLLSTHQLGSAAERLSWAEDAIAGNETNPELLTIVGQVAAMRSTLARFAGDLPLSVTLGQKALARMQRPHRSPAAVVSAAHEFLVSGDVSPAAEQRLALHLDHLADAGHPAVVLRGRMLLAWMRVMQGRLREAEEVLRGAPRAIPHHETGLAVIVGGPAYYFGLGDLLREWNKLDEAAGLLDQGMLLARGTLAVEPDIVLGGVVALARTLQARGESSAARGTLLEYERSSREHSLAPHLLARLHAAGAQLALVQGRLDDAVEWADTRGPRLAGAASYLQEPEYLAFARVRIAQSWHDPLAHRVDEVLQRLERLRSVAESEARRGSLIEILMLRALAHYAHSRRHEAFAALAHALALGSREGYTRIFVDEGAPMTALLAQAVADPAWAVEEGRHRSEVRAYAEKLLAVSQAESMTQ